MTKMVEMMRGIYDRDPHRFSYLFILISGLIIRVVVSLSQWGILHPDEIFQSMEIAHKLVFGSGHLPPEFMNTYELVPSYAASRSHIFPLIMALIMYTGKVLSWDYFGVTLPLIKIVLALNSTLLLPVVYRLTVQITKDKHSGLYAMAFCAYWFRIIELTTRSLYNTFFLPYLLWGIYLVLRSLEKDVVPSRDYLMIGLNLGLVTYVRVDLGIMVFFFFIFTLDWTQRTKYLGFLLSSISFWVLGALVDYWMFEGVQFFSVPVNWFRFNILENHSDIFGTSSPLFYFTNLILGDLLIIWLVPALIILYNHGKEKKESSLFIRDDRRRQGFSLLLKVTMFTWLVYSYPIPTLQTPSLDPIQFPIGIRSTHKELRFLTGGLVLFFILTASYAQEMVRWIVQALSRLSVPQFSPLDQLTQVLKSGNSRRRAVAIFWTVFLAVNLSVAMVRSYNDVNEDINLALMYVGQQDRVDSLMVMEPWFRTGMYTYSHLPENVTIYWTYYDNPNYVQFSNENLDFFFSEYKISKYLIIDNSSYADDFWVFARMKLNQFVVVHTIGMVTVFHSTLERAG